MLDVKSLMGGIDSNGLIGRMIGGMATKNFAAGLLTGGVATSLLGRKDTVETVAKVGGLALLGTLAYKAYGNYQQQKTVGGNASVKTAVTQSAQGMISKAGGLLSGLMGNNQAAELSQPLQANNPEQNQANSELAIAIIRAMIGAAKADGHMDEAETQKIMGNMESGGLSAQEKSLLMREIANNPNVTVIAQGVSKPEDAAQVYLAALIVCDSQCTNEQNYLRNLANVLKLEEGFTNDLQQQLLAVNSQAA
jgi:uncharacterized membrane protein YebE (DUF533 family)